MTDKIESEVLERMRASPASAEVRSIAGGLALMQSAADGQVARIEHSVRAGEITVSDATAIVVFLHGMLDVADFFACALARLQKIDLAAVQTEQQRLLRIARDDAHRAYAARTPGSPAIN